MKNYSHSSMFSMLLSRNTLKHTSKEDFEIKIRNFAYSGFAWSALVVSYVVFVKNFTQIKSDTPYAIMAVMISICLFVFCAVLIAWLKSRNDLKSRTYKYVFSCFMSFIVAINIIFAAYLPPLAIVIMLGNSAVSAIAVYILYSRAKKFYGQL